MCTKENTKMEKRMEKDSINGKTVKSMTENGFQESKKDMAYGKESKENPTSVNGRAVKLKVSGYTFGLMEIDMKVNGKHAFGMAMGPTFSLMTICISVSTCTVSQRDTVNTNGKMATTTKEPLKMDLSMEMASGESNLQFKVDDLIVTRDITFRI